MMVPYTTRLDLVLDFSANSVISVTQTSALKRRVMASHGVGWATERIFLVARAVSQLKSEGM